MTKKGPLGKIEKFYIVNHLEIDRKKLYEDLDRTKNIVDKFIKTLPKQEVVTSSKQEVEAPKPNISDQFARTEDGGAVVMTPNASEMADKKSAEYRSKAKSRVRTSCVTTIKDK